MYVIPIAILVVVCVIATAWAPLFALIVAVPLFLGFLAYVGMSRRADQTIQTPGAGSSSTVEDETPKGAWGEPRP